MFADVLSELIGIWISVRLIDFFIASNEATESCPRAEFPLDALD
jgi:hypothetical protein